MSNKPLHFSTICQANQQLQQISKRAQKLTQLNSILQEILPSQFAGHCQLANMKDNKIIIHTEVKPQHPTEKSAKSNMIDMSNNNAALIAQTAAGLDDGQLKTALHKLAKRGKTRDNS